MYGENLLIAVFCLVSWRPSLASIATRGKVLLTTTCHDTVISKKKTRKAVAIEAAPTVAAARCKVVYY